MEHVPDIALTDPPTELLRWMAYERDAVWVAKIAILRAQCHADIAYFGACLREHERHGKELALLARRADRTLQISMDPSFVTEEAFVMGAVEGQGELIAAMTRVESARIARYEARRPGRVGDPTSLLSGLLDRHLADARARLAQLARLGEARRDVAA